MFSGESGCRRTSSPGLPLSAQTNASRNDADKNVESLVRSSEWVITSDMSCHVYICKVEQ